MQRKIFKVENLANTDSIVVTSKGGVIDFLEQYTLITVYFDEQTEPEYSLEAGKFVINNDQKKSTVLHLPAKGRNATVVIENTTGYDLEEIIVARLT